MLFPLVLFKGQMWITEFVRIKDNPDLILLMGEQIKIKINRQTGKVLQCHHSNICVSDDVLPFYGSFFITISVPMTCLSQVLGVTYFLWTQLHVSILLLCIALSGNAPSISIYSSRK